MYEGYEQKDEVVQLYLDDIIPNRFQPREVFDETALKELAVSIKEHGVIQPIIVRNVNGKYEIIAGERRYKASALAGLTKIPAIIRNLDDKESSKVALLENLQRKNLNPIEEARTYQKILELDQMTQEELAKTMGKSQSSVANKIRLLSLPEDIQDALLKEKISERHARALLSVPDSDKQKELMEKVISNKMSVRALEEAIQELYPKPKDAADIPIDVNATAGGFINSTPLIPTASTVPEDSENYGKVVIAPPKEAEESMEEESKEEISTDKFVNYGEIGKDSTPDVGMNGEEIPSTSQNIDVNEIRNNSTDIKLNNSGAEIDNLLNIQSTSSEPLISKEEKEHKDDYFTLPNLPSVNLNTTEEEETPFEQEESNPIIPNIINDPPEVEEEKPDNESETYTLEEATEKLKAVIEDIKSHGIQINADEMNFPKSYQIIIKIDKE